MAKKGKYVFEHPKGRCETCRMYDYSSGNGWSDPYYLCCLITRKNIHVPIKREECPLIEEQ